MARVLFISQMDAERRAVLAETARSAFDAVVLQDLPSEEREAAWATADVVVCTGFGSEFPPDVKSKAPRLRLVQALVAGVDHLPFDRLPPDAAVRRNPGA